ncbi:site-specific DNA-methyltransferase [Candidatus Poribacteria bacterium]|nr:site-specific DNA-methyltransferase [Candidatus Poribacteria bacterium]
MRDRAEQLRIETGSPLFDAVDHARAELSARFADRFVTEPMLTRSLVSFQANKSRPAYRWYKFKEAFSASLVEYFLHRFGIQRGRILDPFAGSGTALFAASAAGIDADGVELLPIGQQIIRARQIIRAGLPKEDLDTLRQWSRSRVWESHGTRAVVPELRVTKGAYPDETKDSIERYLAACQDVSLSVRTILRFALFCVLEEVSFTRKDGQYLRWDYRSGRRQGKKMFDKGAIADFGSAVQSKLTEILLDAVATEEDELVSFADLNGAIRLFEGSCLQVLPGLDDLAYDAIITSPPYCNRYDYTRTYALELALLGVDDRGLGELRQQMLSCTVENRAKDLRGMNPQWALALNASDRQPLLQAILAFLEAQKADGFLNNSGIPRMVRGYFYEMACVIAECSRVMKGNAPLLMVNDNVRYAGVSIPVDAILSHIAEQVGFRVESILVLPNGKGNSSQQMGEHGREVLRKCVYVWRKP